MSSEGLSSLIANLPIDILNIFQRPFRRHLIFRRHDLYSKVILHLKSHGNIQNCHFLSIMFWGWKALCWRWWQKIFSDSKHENRIESTSKESSWNFWYENWSLKLVNQMVRWIHGIFVSILSARQSKLLFSDNKWNLNFWVKKWCRIWRNYYFILRGKAEARKRMRKCCKR